MRGLTLLGAGAAHAVLAKSLFAASPPGVSHAATDLQLGAQVMHYGGDVVGMALAAVLAWQWYTRCARSAPRFGFGRAGTA